MIAACLRPPERLCGLGKDATAVCSDVGEHPIIECKQPPPFTGALLPYGQQIDQTDENFFGPREAGRAPGRRIALAVGVVPQSIASKRYIGTIGYSVLFGRRRSPCPTWYDNRL